MKTLQERVTETFPAIKKLLDDNHIDIGAEAFLTPDGRVAAKPTWIDTKPVEEQKSEAAEPSDTPVEE